MSSRIDLEAMYQRVYEAIHNNYDFSQIADWALKNIKLRGRNLSFKDREYQEKILSSTAPEIVVVKCSQVGMTEAMIIRTLALCSIVDGFNAIFTLPTTIFAQKVMKTRVDPLIAESKVLSSRLSKTLDNASVKGFGNSHLYLTGTNNDNAVISIPADMVVQDEVDFSSQEMLEKLQSRLTASKYRWLVAQSTPTVHNYGVSRLFTNTKRHFNFCKCSHCSHYFIPSFLDHVRIPGYNGDLLSITKAMLNTIRWQEATLLCPNCNKPADLSAEHRQWVCENPEDQGFQGEGYQIFPTDAPNIIKMSDLVLWSTRFDSKVQFKNFHLGIPAEDEDSGLNDSDIEVMKTVGEHSIHGPKVFGIDLGTVCHILVAVTNGVDKLTIIGLHQVPYTDFEKELLRLIRIHRPSTILSDSQPYVETIYRLQERIKNLYGALYTPNKSMEMFRMVNTNEDREKALLRVRQVNINRNFAFNTLMGSIRSGYIGIAPNTPNTSLFIEHIKDMKRVPNGAKRAFSDEPTNTEVESFSWVKTSGTDHFHHTLLYAYIAMHLVKHVPESATVPLVYFNSLRIRNQNL